jgi:glucosamine-phosphate N-acetyltransferase
MIRQATLDDMEQVVQVLSYLVPMGKNIRENLQPETFAKIMDLDSCDTLVWESDGQIVAVGSLWVLQKIIRGYGKMGQIEDVVVLPEYRGSGFGKMIIDALIEKARERGAYKVILNCSDDNIPFYEKCGFTRKENQMRIDL